MPKLPIVSGKDAVKALSKVGFEFRRQVGSHMVLKRVKDGKRVTIPDHDELPKGTLRAIIRQCDLTVEEFIKLL
ncbi:MAG: type II toxin-antitoxin system HicA family toxin [Candidatus Thermoplasmatota archaeon]|jgi:predicted RNA binding protein YcfA (HicA-like mRNA interferase family)|nr:type II toxin-antitoxin system HicA family toxin [Candidatus Thermoplasmatota archaeon]